MISKVHFSGLEESESLNLNDVERASYVVRLPRSRWLRSRENVSSSSESSFKEEESFTAAEWCRPRINSNLIGQAKFKFNRKSGDREGSKVEEETVRRKEEVKSLESQKSEQLSKEMDLSYENHSMSGSSSEVIEQRNDSSEKLYKKRLIYNQFSETSSSANNEGLEESLSSSTNHPFPGYYDTLDSTQGNLRSSSSSSSCQDHYHIGIPMIDEQYPSSSNEDGQEILTSEGSEFRAIPEEQSVSMVGEERRHSEPWRKLKYSIKHDNRKLLCNSSLSIAEVKEDQTPSPAIYTIRLSPSNFGSKKTDDIRISLVNELESKAMPPLASTEYIVCEPKENIFFTMSSNESSAVSVSRVETFNQSYDEEHSDPQMKQLQSTGTSEILSTMYADESELLGPICKVPDPQYNQSLSSFSLTSLESEKSIRPKSSKESRDNVQERDRIWAMNRLPSANSLTAKVTSFIKRRSRSKSRSEGDETDNRSAIGALCRQSIALTVESETVINESSTNVIVTEALVSATSTATATISLSPSLSSTSIAKGSMLD